MRNDQKPQDTQKKQVPRSPQEQERKRAPQSANQQQKSGTEKGDQSKSSPSRSNDRDQGRDH